MASLKTWFEHLARRGFDLNRHNIIALASAAPFPRICDLGCDDGELTLRLASAARAREAYGVEIVEERAKKAAAGGVRTVIGDLNRPLPFADDQFDLVHANQVIEHLANVDLFLSEIRRVLKPGGSAILSTENGSSWHNIAAALLGWQIFSLTNVSTVTGGLGNPLALHRGVTSSLSTWTHKTIFNYRGLLEIHEAHGLKPARVLGAGYHPLPPGLGRVDPRHAHLLAVLAVKPPREPQEAFAGVAEGSSR